MTTMTPVETMKAVRIHAYGGADVLAYEDAPRPVPGAGEVQARSWGVLRKGGIMVSILQPPSQEEAASRGVRGAFTFVQPSAKQLAQIAELVDAEKVRPIVDIVLPLSEARRAQELSRSGHVRGKIVLRVI